jgi:hypothetical protein
MTVPSPTFLARRAAAGDQHAFARLAQRFELLIRATVYEIEGQDLQDARQACLLGLLDACHAIVNDPSLHLAGAVKVRMRSRVREQWRASQNGSTVALVRALELGTGEWQVEIPDDRYDPARVCEVRDHLARAVDAFWDLPDCDRDAIRRGVELGERPGCAQQVRRHRAHKRLRQLANAA